jgi:hypothetical protein
MGTSNFFIVKYNKCKGTKLIVKTRRHLKLLHHFTFTHNPFLKERGLQPFNLFFYFKTDLSGQQF